ncbi:mechanosensitive ion channel family protein [Streptacidiphilus jiangxiensis]|uniref:Small-conductance mechanosensitive channel n=1 Tax=Streptacidiphilus jiangxiensis TaxID=235985 RepID=A0A1H7SNS3_STRJI|nr:mechanosensitive ion channel domain-containing protein [Streptacidiphilus jiangxiensis]SEL73414.1 Small-conductance mechanosensitive channel [Streptacidiphilus jiangxiensis]
MDLKVLSQLIAVTATIGLTLLIGWLVDKLLQRVAAKHPETTVWPLLRRCRIPLQFVVCLSLLLANAPLAQLFDQHADDVRHGLLLALIASAGWLLNRVLAAVLSGFFSRYQEVSDDPSRVQRVRTQVVMLRRTAGALVILVTVGAMLLTFQEMRTLGASLLASAGLIGIVAGIAAQNTLGNFFAGLVIAFGDLVRIGDTVVVEGQQGVVEEITLSYLVVRLWDQRRLVVPVSYFVSRPFENWTRADPHTTGSILLHLDHTTPVAELREQFHRLLLDSKEWDGRDWGLVVFDTTPSTIVVRATMTTRNPDDAFVLKAHARESLIAWLRDHHPDALPRVRTGG